MKEKDKRPQNIIYNQSKLDDQRYLYYNSLRTAGKKDYMLQEFKRISRNVIYSAYCQGIPVSKIYYFYDLFRDKCKPSLMAFINLCNGF